MTRFRVRDVEALRGRMESSQRIVPHSVRSLATLVKANRSTIGYLLTGERPVVNEALAQRIAVALGVPVEDLFAPEKSSSEDEADAEVPAPARKPMSAAVRPGAKEAVS